MQHVCNLQKSVVGVTVLQDLEGCRSDESHTVHNSHDMFLQENRDSKQGHVTEGLRKKNLRQQKKNA